MLTVKAIVMCRAVQTLGAQFFEGCETAEQHIDRMTEELEKRIRADKKTQPLHICCNG